MAFIGIDWGIPGGWGVVGKNHTNGEPAKQINQIDLTGFDKLECEKEKPVCKKCGGTGILDFEFYTRDCFDCKKEEK